MLWSARSARAGVLEIIWSLPVISPRRRWTRLFIKLPVEPETIAGTGIDESELVSLLMKLIYTWRLESTREFSDALKLPSNIIAKLVRIATDQKLVYARGVRPDNATAMKLWNDRDRPALGHGRFAALPIYRPQPR